MVMLCVISCQAPKNAAQSGNNTSLSSIARKPQRFEGKEIQLQGNFLGWKYADCHFPKSFSDVQITRSDWVIHDGKYCCFVMGAPPKGLDPATSNPVPVKLTALVKMKDSKVYLQVVTVSIQ
jgi:hypothetical protein